MKTLIAATVVVASLAGFSTVAMAEESADKLEAAFENRDGNGDGSISRKEYLDTARNAKRAEAVFDKADTDGDGSLSKREFVAGAQKIRDARKGN